MSQAQAPPNPQYHPASSSSSSSSFSLLRIQLSPSHYQDIAFVFHETALSSEGDDGDDDNNDVDEAEVETGPISLHLGGGNRSWRSDHVVGPDDGGWGTGIYTVSDRVVTARPCVGPMSGLATLPDWPRESSTLSKMKRQRNNGGPLSSFLNSATYGTILWPVLGIVALALWCVPALNPHGICPAILDRAKSNIVESFSFDRPTITPAVVPSPQTALPTPSVRVQFLVLDTLQVTTDLLQDSCAQLFDSWLFLVSYVKPFLDDIIDEWERDVRQRNRSSSSNNNRNNRGPGDSTAGGKGEERNEHDEEEKQRRLQGLSSFGSILKYYADHLEMIRTSQERLTKYTLTKIHQFSGAFNSSELDPFSWSATGGRPSRLEFDFGRGRRGHHTDEFGAEQVHYDEGERAALLQLFVQRNEAIFRQFREQVGCPAQKKGRKEGTNPILPLWLSAHETLEWLAADFEEIVNNTFPEMEMNFNDENTRLGGTRRRRAKYYYGLFDDMGLVSTRQLIALRSVLAQGAVEARAGAEAVKRMDRGLGEVCEGLRILKERGWVDKPEPNFVQEAGDGDDGSKWDRRDVTEFWATWPSDAEANKTLAALRLKGIKV